MGNGIVRKMRSFNSAASVTNLWIIVINHWQCHFYQPSHQRTPHSVLFATRLSLFLFISTWLFSLIGACPVGYFGSCPCLCMILLLSYCSFTWPVQTNFYFDFL
jgi:hypothetical protein